MGGHNFPNLKLKPHWAACVTLTQSTQTSLSCMLDTQTSFFWEPWHSNLTELHSNLFFGNRDTQEPWHSNLHLHAWSDHLHALIWPPACVSAALGGSRPSGGRQAPLFFLPGTSLQIWRKKKLHLGPVAPHRATGGSFEIFQNGHIFLKFWFFFK